MTWASWNHPFGNDVVQREMGRTCDAPQWHTSRLKSATKPRVQGWERGEEGREGGSARRPHKKVTDKVRPEASPTPNRASSVMFDFDFVGLRGPVKAVAPQVQAPIRVDDLDPAPPSP